LNKLCEGAQLELVALPNPPETFFAGEDGEEFELALAKAKELDPIYKQLLADCNGEVVSNMCNSDQERLLNRKRFRNA